MNMDANTLRVKLNLENYGDPFYDTKPPDRAGMQAALDTLVRRGQIKKDSNGHYAIIRWQSTGRGYNGKRRAANHIPV